MRGSGGVVAATMNLWSQDMVTKKKRKTNLRFLFVLALALFPGLGVPCIVSVNADTSVAYKVTGPTTETDVSGPVYRPRPRRFDVTPQNIEGLGILSGLVFSEKNDKPCRIELLSSTTDNRTIHQHHGNVEPPTCSGWNGPSQREVKFDANKTWGIKAIRVSTTDKRNADDRLKGVEIRFGRPGKIANNEKPWTTDKFRRTNASKWHRWVSCPAGQVAVGIAAYSGEGGFSAIALRCRALVRM
jgi:hypothetical protein